MCIKFENIRQELEILNTTEIAGYHMDIMDGSFVPNFALGINDIRAVRKLTDKEIDLHLMVENTDNQINCFLDLGVDRICVHFESTKHLDRTIRLIKSRGIKVGIALNPSTPAAVLDEIISDIDYILIMAVNPGFASQTYIDYSTNKIDKLIRLRFERKLKFEIEVDGSMSEEKVKLLDNIGVDSFVLGTAALFYKGEDYETIVSRIVSKEFIPTMKKSS